MSVCSADRSPEPDLSRVYERSEIVAIHREDIKAYLAECGGRVSLADLVVDVLPTLGMGHNLLGRLLYSGVAKGILELQGLNPEVVLLKSTPGAQ